MVLSRAQCAAIMTHILEDLFDHDPDSNLPKAMTHNGIKSPIDLCAEDEAQLDGYRYPNGKPAVITILSRGEIGLLKSFKRFVAYRTAMGQPIHDTGWIIITRQEFDDFRVSGNNSLATMAQPMCPPPPQLDP